MDNLKNSLKSNFVKEETGAITVWMTLLSVCVLAFVIVVIEGIRIINAQNITSNSSNLAALSLLADYDLDIYENYNLYVMSKDIDEMVYKDYARSTLDGGIDIASAQIYDIMYLDNESLEKQISYNDSFYDYLIKNFSSYKKPYIKGYMARKYAYELEYMIGGKEKDNDNIKIIKDKMKDTYAADMLDELEMTREEYELFVIDYLEQVDKKVLLQRIREIIISNINTTFDKKLDKDKLVIGMSIKSTYVIDNHLRKFGFVENIFGNLNNKYVVNIVLKSITYDRII